MVDEESEGLHALGAGLDPRLFTPSPKLLPFLLLKEALTFRVSMGGSPWSWAWKERHGQTSKDYDTKGLGRFVFLHLLLVNGEFRIFLIQGSAGVKGQDVPSHKVMYIFVASVGDREALLGVGL